MSSKNVTNKPASVHQKLLNKARAGGRPFSELLQYYGMERFLYRLGLSPHADKFILKGALMFVAWRTEATRPTMDIDLLGRTDNDPEAVKTLAIDICRQPTAENDGITFDTRSITAERITEDADYTGVRIRFTGLLGKAKFPMQLDIGFGDVMTPGPSAVDYPPMLDTPAPSLQGYNRETAVAEKFEAMVKLSELNTRMKDFFDIWYLSQSFSFDGRALLEACRSTFNKRGTAITPTPTALTTAYGLDATRQRLWTAFRKKSRLVQTPESFSAIHAPIANFLSPIAKAMASEGAPPSWWSAGGPWANGTAHR